MPPFKANAGVRWRGVGFESPFESLRERGRFEGPFENLRERGRFESLSER